MSIRIDTTGMYVTVMSKLCSYRWIFYYNKYIISYGCVYINKIKIFCIYDYVLVTAHSISWRLTLNTMSVSPSSSDTFIPHGYGVINDKKSSSVYFIHKLSRVAGWSDWRLNPAQLTD